METIKRQLANWLISIFQCRRLPVVLREWAFGFAWHLQPIGGGADSTNAQIGATVDLHYWNTSLSPDAYSELGQVRSINGVGVTKAEVDSTTLDSTAMEYIGGLENGDQVTIVFTTGAANTNIDRIRGWVTGTSEIDFKLVVNAPATENLFFSATPLHWDLGTIQPNSLIELTFQGRITGGVSSTDPHP